MNIEAMKNGIPAGTMVAITSKHEPKKNVTVYVVTVQGRFIDVKLSHSKAEMLSYHLYMQGNDGIVITEKQLEN